MYSLKQLNLMATEVRNHQTITKATAHVTHKIVKIDENLTLTHSSIFIIK